MGFQIFLKRDTGESVTCGEPIQDLDYAINRVWQILHVFCEESDIVELIGNELDAGYKTVFDEFSDRERHL